MLNPRAWRVIVLFEHFLEVRMFARSFFLTVIAVLLSGLGSQARADTLTELSVEQMTDASDLIVRGTVTQVFPEMDERGNVWTRAQVEISEVLKGESETRAVMVDQVGGVYGNKYSVVRLASRFSVGEEAIFFLEHLRSGRTSVVGWYQGKFTVRVDPDSTEEMLVRFTISQDRPYHCQNVPNLFPNLSDPVLGGREKPPGPSLDGSVPSLLLI